MPFRSPSLMLAKATHYTVRYCLALFPGLGTRLGSTIYTCTCIILLCTIIIVGPYQQAPGNITLTDVRPGQVIFSWSQIDSNCPAVQYQNTFNCGRCSLAIPTSTLANCYDLQLSTTARNCTFSVSSEICGFTGPSSNPITVTLKGMLLRIYNTSAAWTRLSILRPSCFVYLHYCSNCKK